MKRPRKKMSAQKLALIKKFQHGGGQPFASDQAEDDPLTKQAPPEATAQDFKHTLPTKGAMHRRHK